MAKAVSVKSAAAWHRTELLCDPSELLSAATAYDSTVNIGVDIVIILKNPWLPESRKQRDSH